MAVSCTVLEVSPHCQGCVGIQGKGSWCQPHGNPALSGLLSVTPASLDVKWKALVIHSNMTAKVVLSEKCTKFDKVHRYGTTYQCLNKQITVFIHKVRIYILSGIYVMEVKTIFSVTWHLFTIQRYFTITSPRGLSNYSFPWESK